MGTIPDQGMSRQRSGVSRAAGQSACRCKTSVKSILLAVLLLAQSSIFASMPASAAEQIPFAEWREGLRGEAALLGVTKITFDKAFKGVTPDLTLPDLVKRGQKPRPGAGQAEFSKTPEQYLNRRYLLRLAARGKKLAQKHSATLAKVETRFGVPKALVLAIWGRETSFGSYKLRHYAIRALATQAYLGRRKELFRKELLFALKMLQDGVATRADMRSSWAGALGLTQTLPSEFYTMVVDMDGDGRKDIWRSVPDALGSAAKQLNAKGWVRGQSWGYEVILSKQADCSLEGPDEARTLAEWEALGLKRTFKRRFSGTLRDVRAYLMSPAGAYGPSFLVTENFSVIKRYNFSDLYAVFVGHLADRIGGAGNFATKWAKIRQLPRGKIALIQERLKNIGYPIGKIDGLIGSNTRAQIGRFEKQNGMAVRCWPSRAVLTAIGNAGQ